MQEAEACLADDVAGVAARAYLAGRGLQPTTWQAWRLGFHLTWQPVRREALPAITLPWFGADGTLQAVQYRYFGPGIAKHERFGQKAGGQRSLFGLQRLSGRATLIITEGELTPSPAGRSLILGPTCYPSARRRTSVRPVSARR